MTEETDETARAEAIRAEGRALLEADRAAVREADERNPVLPSVRSNPTGAATILLDRFFTSGKYRQIAYYREAWYSYFKKLWSERHEDDMMHFLHVALLGCRQVNREDEVEDFNCCASNVRELLWQVQQLISIPSHYSAPVALIDKEWKQIDASGKIVCRGQIVDLMTGEVSGNHHLFIPNGAEWVWSDKAKSPKSWLKFLDDLFKDKPEEVALLQEWMGYVLSGDMWAHKGLILVGPARAGKGTIGHVLSALLGDSMVASPSLNSLGKDFGLQNLLDKRLCLISDARLSNRADIVAVIEVLLRITAGDAIDVGRKHKSSLQTRLGARVMLMSNEMPRLGDTSNAISTRFLILRVTESFLGREDINLLGRLNKELPGIALWAAEGYRTLRERGRFVEPETSSMERDEWYNENNPLGQFIEDRIKVDAEGKIAMARLYDAYRIWSEASGMQPMPQNGLSRQLSIIFGSQIRRMKSGSTRYILGIDLLAGDL